DCLVDENSLTSSYENNSVAAFDHGPHTTDEVEHPETVARNTRYGLILFAVYLACYGAYVLTNAFAPQVMERMPVAGINLAVLSGFGLIALAFLLALFYGWLCRSGAGETVDADEERRA
ncbi:MAG: DUF485 domain-containing protein, partial [Planctomycetaceae bacterium]